MGISLLVTVLFQIATAFESLRPRPRARRQAKVACVASSKPMPPAPAIVAVIEPIEWATTPASAIPPPWLERNAARPIP